MCKVKNSLERFNNKLDTAKERKNVLEQVNGNYPVSSTMETKSENRRDHQRIMEQYVI